LAVAGICGGCGGGGRSPAATVSAFLAAWQRDDGTGMAALVDRPDPGFGPSVRAITAGLHATSVTRVAGRVSTHGSNGSVPLTSTYNLPGVGTWKATSTLDLVHRSGQWLVAWSPAAVAEGLAPGQSLELHYDWPARAAILGAGGAPLVDQQPQVVVGVEGSRIKDPAALSTQLVASGATQEEVTSALAAAAMHPTYFEPVVTISAARYAQLGGDAGALYQAPGTVFQHTSARDAVTPGLATHLVGQVGPVTADELARLGSPYSATSTVGQNGLEAYYEKQMAGRPGGSVEAVAGGRVASTLARFDSSPGQPVSTTIDPAVQADAEQAMASVPGTAALVAIKVSTGGVLAAVSLPATTPFDAALDGEFPPGSTFKVLTATALLEAGLGPESGASCPPSVNIGGEVFHNAEGDQPVSTITQAFTESCNTAFAQLASSHLSASSFESVASQFGIGTPVQFGYPAAAGRVPAPSDDAALAATSIGQASVVLSPLNLAAVAADVARGSVVAPRLVAGAPDDSVAPRPLPGAVVADLHSMMASVVTSGTAANTGLPAGTFAKTGTAQYGQGNPLPTDAWLIGWNGDVAFAIVVQNSTGNGGPVDGPVVARFLAGLPASYR
jgi:cell division protein FtsI/penicillin-binding protein 2